MSRSHTLNPGRAVEEAATEAGRARPWGAMTRVSIIGTFVLLLALVVHQGSYFLAPVSAGLLVGFSLGPLGRALERRGIPAAVSSVGIVLGTLLVLAGILAALAVPMETWSRRLPDIGANIASEWDRIRGPIEKLRQVEQRVKEAAEDESKPMRVTVIQSGFVTGLVASAPDVAARLLLFLGTFGFFLATRGQLKRGTLALFGDGPTRRRAARVMRDAEFYLSRYVATISLVNVGLGVVVALVMFALGLPSPHLWGAMAAIFNFAPYIGPAVMAAVLFGVGMAVNGSVLPALVPVAVYVGINVLEGQFVTPALLGRRLTLNPLVVFLSLALWLWLWGVIGAFIAVPILIICTMVYHHMIARLPAVPVAARRPRPTTPLLAPAG